MRPTTAEQLDGIARILSEVVAPDVNGRYPSEILAAAIDTLHTLAAGYERVPGFLDWDTAATAEVLTLAGVAVPDMADEALEDRHRRVRGTLESNMAAVMAHPEAAAAMMSQFRERIERFPLTSGGWRAHTPR